MPRLSRQHFDSLFDASLYGIGVLVFLFRGMCIVRVYILKHTSDVRAGNSVGVLWVVAVEIYIYVG